MEQDTEEDVPALRDDEVTQDLTLDWVEEGTLPEPKDKTKDTPGCLRRGCENNFRSPVVSFMSTLPLIFWKVSFGESTSFAHHEMRKARAKGLTENKMCGTKWKQDITLGEFMVFFGILLQMCLFLLPWNLYVLYWAYGAVMYPFINKIPLRCFQQIRSVLHFNDNQTMPVNDDDLQKIRTCVNIVKVTLRVFIRIGSELALDEASVAFRSSYGCAVIFFNLMKNCAKFQFRFYFICFATMFAQVHVKVI
jgi:hypothetical protein